MRLLLFLSVLLFGFLQSAQALEAIEISDDFPQTWVKLQRAQYFEDTSANIPFKQIVLDNNIQSNFESLDDGNPFSENASSAYWLKILLVDKRTKEVPVRIELYDFNIDEVSVYFPESDGQYTQSKSGFSIPFHQREIDHKNVSFLVPKLPNDSNYVYLRFKSKTPCLIKPVIRKYDELINYGLNEYINFGVFYGLMILVIFYNLLYFILLRQKHYIYYVFYASCVLFYLMANNGTGFQFIWPKLPEINPYIDKVLIFGSSIFMLLFANNFLEIRKRSTLIYRLIIIALVLRAAMFCLSLLLNHEDIDRYMDIFYVQLALAIGLWAKSKGFKSANWYVIAFCVLDIAFLISFLEGLGLIESGFFTVYASNFGIILQFSFLSISIAESVKETYEQNHIAQAKLIEEYKKNEELADKVNRELEDKVKERTKALNEQKEVVEEKNKQILSSVRYASNIQVASLPTIHSLNQIIPDHFILFMPRDIVSGDFYWTHSINKDEYLIAAVDCTGHGVPGAFMSMIGINLLNRIVSENILEPNDILSALHHNIQEVLNQKDSRNPDGMDMSICRVNRKTKQIDFSGARNPLIYIQNGKIERIKGTRKSIGGISHEDFSFEKHSISFANASVQYYLLSDGYVDQMGGPHNKKYLTKSFMEKVLSIQNLTMKSQGEKLEEEIIEWMQTSSFQLDDILVMGVKEG